MTNQPCENSDKVAIERVNSIMSDIQETIKESGSEQEFAMLQKRLAWAIIHIIRFHPNVSMNELDEMFWND